LNCYTEFLTDRTEYGGDVIHAGVSLPGKHVVETLDWSGSLGCKFFKADRGTYKFAKNQTGSFQLAVEECRCSFARQALVNLGSLAARSATVSLNERVGVTSNASVNCQGLSASTSATSA